jgi:hypothetical protein
MAPCSAEAKELNGKRHVLQKKTLHKAQNKNAHTAKTKQIFSEASHSST